MDKRNILSRFHKFQLNREQAFAPKFYKAIRNQYKTFIHALKSGNVHPLVVPSHELRQVIKLIYLDSVHYGSLVYSQLPKVPKKVKRRTPLGFNEEMIELINQWFKTGWLNTAETITNTTRELIQVVMGIATEEGRDLDWIVDQLENESIDISKSRSRLIARTETVTATNQAAFFAAAKTGLMYKKEWLSASDNRVRPHHINVNGSRVDMNDYFTLQGGTKILLPGARVQENGLITPISEIANCRCVATYEAVRNTNGRLIEYDYNIWHPAIAA